MSVRKVSPAPVADAFSLFGTEEAVLARTDLMLDRLSEVAGGVRDLAQAYRRSYREQRRLVRLSDRMQGDLQRANARLAEQQREMQALNAALSGEIEQRIRLEGELRRAADTDHLTGALTRRRFLAVGAREAERGRSGGLPACLLMLDLDRFKTINDAFGHAAGDAALVAFVETCRGLLRERDGIGRMGGEEFAILLAETDREAGLAFAERLRAAVAGTRVASEKGPLAITASLGLAVLRPGDALAEWLNRADAALYAAKAAGRNRVACEPAS
ncbi:diguanylate cyclase [Methylobacterium sp. 4-46]|uniref:GGDEF domain-containing protein n=1 Tax=unclassified Methylobacterium TaxID=2615210 RepID=UPI000152EA9A|nr:MULTISPECIES: GGDEF domain-containing protein [Methylobacterium]ACA16273.1 diguanylate cyclase [Methylobacterium sp. 4-46]WFT81983.1 diguanylate cyclase [Methylobacterium nodulans]